MGVSCAACPPNGCYPNYCQVPGVAAPDLVGGSDYVRPIAAQAVRPVRLVADMPVDEHLVATAHRLDWADH